jgi:type VI secretion system secreted protein VgrG
MPKHAAAKLEVSGTSYDCVRVQGVEALSTLFRYHLVLEVPLPLPPLATVLGADATLVFDTDVGASRRVTGIVAEARARATDEARDGRGGRERGSGRIDLVLRPAAYALTLGRDCYCQQDVDVVASARYVLANHERPIRWEITRSYPESPYRAQYREDDWTYVSRLFEEEGIFTWFDHAMGSMLVVGDDSTSADDIPGGALLRYVEDSGTSGLETSEETVSELQSYAVAAPGRFAVRGFDPAKPQLAVEATTGDGRHEVYDAPGGGPRDPAIARARAVTMAEASRAARAGIAGTTTCIRLVPGRAIEIVDHPVPSLGGRFLVTSVQVATNDDGTWSWSFTALPADVPFRPLPVTPRARQAGLQTGVVVGPPGQEVHPDAAGRVRVQQHWDRTGARDDRSGTFMRVAQRMAPGSMLLPRMGWNVCTFNEEGGVDAPSIICRIHDAEHPPEYALPGNMTRVVYKTATTPGGGSHNEIYFEDAKGAEEMFVNASKDLFVRVRHVRMEAVGNDATLAVGNTKETQVGETYTMDVKQDQTRAVGADQSILVQQTRVKTVQGDDVATIGGSRRLSVGASHDLHVKKDRTLRAPILLDLTLGTVSSSAKDAALLVGGVALKVSAEDVDERAAKVAVQAVGGAKVELAKRNRSLAVGKKYFETVGAVMSLKAGGKFTEAAGTTNAWKVAGSLEGKAPVLHVEADKSIKIKCGSSVLTITEKTIELEGPKLELTGGTLDADTEAIEHN